MSLPKLTPFYLLKTAIHHSSNLACEDQSKTNITKGDPEDEKGYCFTILIDNGQLVCND